MNRGLHNLVIVSTFFFTLAIVLGWYVGSDSVLKFRKRLTPEVTRNVLEFGNKNKRPTRLRDVQKDKVETKSWENFEPGECRGDIQNFLEKDLSDALEQLQDSGIRLSDSCILALARSDFPLFFIRYARECLGGFVRDEIQRDLCASRLPRARALWIGAHYASVEDLEEQSDSVLSYMLEANLSQASTMTVDSANRAIEVADELIRRDPNSYAAYKSKMMLFLLKESRWGEKIEDESYEELLGSLAQFESDDPGFELRDEDVLDAEEEKLGEIQDRLEELYAEREELESEFLVDSDEEENYEESVFASYDDFLLEQEVEDLEAQASEIEEVLEDGILGDSDFDADIVRLSFMRYMARGDLDGMIEEAESFSEDYPESPLGPYYLALGLWKSGDRSEALRIMDESVENNSRNRVIYELFVMSRNRSVEDTIAKELRGF